MAYLRLDKDNRFDSDWKNEMALVSEGMADQDYCKKMEIEAPITGMFRVCYNRETALTTCSTIPPQSRRQAKPPPRGERAP